MAGTFSYSPEVWGAGFNERAIGDKASTGLSVTALILFEISQLIAKLRCFLIFF
jgi:hypothetical protein